MPSSHTPNAGTWTLGELWIIFQNFELSVSLEESCTLMEEFISTLSSISTDSSALERLQFSMWEAAIQTSRSLEALLRRVTTTRSRMETWWAEDWSVPCTRAEVALGRLILSGARSSWQNLLTSFGDFAMNWFRNMWLEVLLRYPNTPSGDIDPRLLLTRHPLEYGSTRQLLMESVCGSVRLIWDLEHLERGESSFAVSLRGRNDLWPGAALSLTTRCLARPVHPLRIRERGPTVLAVC